MLNNNGNAKIIYLVMEDVTQFRAKDIASRVYLGTYVLENHVIDIKIVIVGNTKTISISNIIPIASNPVYLQH